MFETKALIRPSSIVVYNQYVGERRNKLLPILTARAVNAGNGLLSVNASRRFRLCIENLIYTATYKTVFVRSTEKYFRYKCNFVTLTLPSLQVHTDAEIVRLVLSPFLEAWQKRRPGFLYVWKAEVQDNGNIHFHLTTNSFIHYDKLRMRWNKAINKLGYVDRSTSPDPNSTDVHAVSNIKNLAAYMVSYMNKKDLYTKPLKRYFKTYGKRLKDENRTVCHLPKNYFNRLKRRVSCAVWGASKCLSNKGAKVDYLDAEHRIAWKVLERLKDDAIQKDYVYIYPLEFDALKALTTFNKAYMDHFKKLVSIQDRVSKYEVIETL